MGLGHAPVLSGCVTLDRYLNLSVIPFPPLENGHIDSACFLGLFNFLFCDNFRLTEKLQK